jgi:hypothetical protein
MKSHILFLDASRIIVVEREKHLMGIKLIITDEKFTGMSVDTLPKYGPSQVSNFRFNTILKLDLHFPGFICADNELYLIFSEFARHHSTGEEIDIEDFEDILARYKRVNRIMLEEIIPESIKLPMSLFHYQGGGCLANMEISTIPDVRIYFNNVVTHYSDVRILTREDPEAQEYRFLARYFTNAKDILQQISCQMCSLSKEVQQIILNFMTCVTQPIRDRCATDMEQAYILERVYMYVINKEYDDPIEPQAKRQRRG